MKNHNNNIELQQIEKPGNSPFLDSHEIKIIKFLLNAVHDIIIIINAQMDTVFVNDIFLKLADIKQEEIYGKRVGELFACAHVNYPQRCTTTELCRFCNTLKAIQNALEEKPCIDKTLMLSGKIESYYWEIKTTPIYWKNHKYIIISFKDVTEETRKENLERIFYHDIMNTVSLIKGFIDIIKNSGYEMYNKYFPLVSKLTDLLVTEINSHRQIRDAENSQLIINKQNINSLQIIREIRESYSIIDDASYNRIIINEKSESINFTSDISLLYRILNNMIKNALEATTNKDKILLSCFQEQNFIVFAVNNPGKIDDNIKPFIFRRTITSKGKGRGFGTYSMKLLGEKYLNGHVYFDTSEENGTTFYLKLPINYEK